MGPAVGQFGHIFQLNIFTNNDCGSVCVQPDAVYRKVILNGPATHYRVREQVLGTYTARLRAPNLGHSLPSHTARSTGAEQLYMLAILCACGAQGGLTWCSNRVWPWWPAPGTVGKQRADVTKAIRGYVTVNLCECPRMSAYRRISNPRICEYLCEL